MQPPHDHGGNAIDHQYVAHLYGPYDDGHTILDVYDGRSAALDGDDRRAALRAIIDAAIAAYVGQPRPARQFTSVECAALDALGAVVERLPTESALTANDWHIALYGARQAARNGG